MKKIYDKVLLLLGIVVLGLGVGYVFSKGPLPVLVTSPKTSLPTVTGKAYAAIPTPPVPDAQPEWNAPDSQVPYNWTYYVFTPPKIYWDGHEFVAEQVNKESLPSYGMHFVGLRQELARIQFMSRTGDGDNAVYSFQDTVNGHIDVLKKGETSKDLNFKLVDFNSVNQTVDGLPLTLQSVTIQDGGDSNKQVVLYRNEKAYIQGKQFLLLETEPPLAVKPFRVMSTTDSLKLEGKETGNPDIPSVVFRVTDVNFNFDNPTVALLKDFTWKGKERHDPIVLTPLEPSEKPPH